MPLREATWGDLLPASKFLAAAFRGDSLFTECIHPYIDKYPDDMYLFFLRELRLDFYAGPDHHLVVTYKVDEDGSETCITGLAHWIRKRPDHPSLGLYNQTMAKAIGAFNYLESFIWPNRAMEPSRADILDRTMPFTEHHWSGTRSESWYLALIGVDPAHEKQGYGRQLVNWAFERAKEEGVTCSVISADGKTNFYHSCGFDVDVGKASDEGGEGNPLREVKGGTIHFWDNGRKPEGIKKYGEA